jgi:hypothetical protein
MRIFAGKLRGKDQEELKLTGRIDLVHELGSDEYSQYLASSKAILAIRSDSDLFTMIEWNHRAYAASIEMYVKARAAGANEIFSNVPPNLEINRQFLNLLSSIRSYLDHHQTRITRRHGPESSNLVNWKKYCADKYDNSFSYRFLYKLRDYAQHCGLPIGYISFLDELDKNDPTVRVITMDVGVSRNQILEGFNWKTLRKEIESQPETIDVNGHLSAVMSDLFEIAQNVLRDEITHIINDAQFILHISHLAGDGKGQPAIFTVADDFIKDDDPPRLDLSQVSFTPVPLDLAEQVIDLSKR